MDSKDVVLLQMNPRAVTQEQMYAHASKPKKNFTTIFGQQSHTIRRRVILEKHPEIRNYMKPDRYYSIIIALMVVIAQVVSIATFSNASWPFFLLGAYCINGQLNRTTHVLIHDFTHMLGHPNPMVNRLFAIFCNIPAAIPAAISFGKYHAQHHNFMGIEGKDTDLPLRSEASIFQGPILKFLYIFNMPLAYLGRPLFSTYLPMKKMEYVNLVFILSTNYLFYKYVGPWSLLYMVLGLYFSLGFNIGAMHLIAEHYQFVQKQESYDYIGPYNYLNLNVGYHIEHHDFPTVPWYYLPKVRETAKQFYEPLPHHTSYWQVFLRFLLDSNFGLFHRIQRVQKQ